HSVLDVADCTGRPLDDLRHPLVAFCQGHLSPVDLVTGATALLPLGADRGQVVGEGKSGAAAFSPGDDVDAGVGQPEARVELGDPRVIPPLDLAEKDVHVNVAL